MVDCAWIRPGLDVWAVGFGFGFGLVEGRGGEVSVVRDDVGYVGA